MDTRYNPHPSNMRVPLCQPPRLDPAARGGFTQARVRLRTALSVLLERPVDQIVLTASGRVALSLGLRALAWSRGQARSEVIIPGFACPQLAEAVLDAGLRPVLCDTAMDCPVPDLAALEAARSPQTLAVVAASVLGARVDLEGISRWARSCGVAVIDDAAQAFAGQTRGPRFGAGGEFGVLSFGRHKPVCAGAGGALVINDLSVAKGLGRATTELDAQLDKSEAAKPRPWFTDVRAALEHPPRAPSRLEMSEVEAQAALARLDEGEQQGAASLAQDLLARLSGTGLLRPRPHNTDLPRLFFAVEVEPRRRHALARRLATAGVESSWLYLPLHHARRYRTFARRPLVHAEALWPKLLLLPVRGWLNEAQREHLGSALEVQP